MDLTVAIEIPAKADVIWHRIVAWEAQPTWMKDADWVRVLTQHREGRGVRLAVRTRVLSIPLFTEKLEITEWDPARRLRLAHMGFVRGFGEWTLEPDAERTLFRWTERISLPVPILGELALLAYRPLLRRLMEGSLRNLRDWLSGD